LEEEHQYQKTFDAGVVKLVDTRDSKSRALKSVPVQVRPSVPHLYSKTI
jgi:hypothetical protein